MNIDLLQSFNSRLHRHFKALATTSKENNFPIFALEHGLSDDEIDQIELGLQTLRESYPSLMNEYWLLWIVYSAEVGYKYEGLEYWPIFEDQIRDWENQDRYKIRKWFRKFHKEYNGVVPNGQWAEHFTLISWPITHSILPRYLQTHFAKALNDSSYKLMSLGEFNPETIGRLLATNVYMPTNKFQDFIQQEELIGRIALALIDEQTSFGNQLIYEKTLKRIVSDLYSHNASREWLKETRNRVADRFKGIGQGKWPPKINTTTGKVTTSGIGISRYNICPRLLLRHSGNDIWSVMLDIPSFYKVSSRIPNLKSFLNNTRCQLNGASDIKPRGWILSSHRRGILHSWPDFEKPLLKFEKSDPLIEQLLETECIMSKGPFWLFRIRKDGTAIQILGENVRPNCNYVVVTTRDIPQSNELMSACVLDCKGATAYRLNIPVNISTELHEWFKNIGLEVNRTIQVWPSGLPYSYWDGEGSCECLTTDSPVIGVYHDHPVEAYGFSLNENSEQIIQTEDTNPLFFQIQPLTAGNHTLKVKEHRSQILKEITSSPAEGYLNIFVREPEPYKIGNTSQSGLNVNIEPPQPNLDTLWQKNVSIEVIGPKNYSVSLELILELRDGKKSCFNINNTLDLPLISDKWHRIFEKFLESEEIQKNYLEATSGKLVINGDTLGTKQILFEQDSKPLRWQTKPSGDSKIIIRLLDDTGQEEIDAEVRRYDMEYPSRYVSVQFEEARSGLDVNPPGSLFYVKYKNYTDIIAVSKTSKDYYELAFKPKVKVDRKQINFLLQVLKKWYEARPFGHIIYLKREQVLDEIMSALFKTLCGNNWFEAEKNYRLNPLTQELEKLKSLVAKNKFIQRYAEDLSNQNWSELAKSPTERTRKFFEITKHFGVSNNKQLCEFALQLASRPYLISTLYQDKCTSFIGKISDNPDILRGVRLIILLSQKEIESKQLSILPRWHW